MILISPNRSVSVDSLRLESQLSGLPPKQTKKPQEHHDIEMKGFNVPFQILNGLR